MSIKQTDNLNAFNLTKQNTDHSLTYKGKSENIKIIFNSSNIDFFVSGQKICSINHLNVFTSELKNKLNQYRFDILKDLKSTKIPNTKSINDILESLTFQPKGIIGREDRTVSYTSTPLPPQEQAHYASWQEELKIDVEKIHKHTFPIYTLLKDNGTQLYPKTIKDLQILFNVDEKVRIKSKALKDFFLKNIPNEWKTKALDPKYTNIQDQYLNEFVFSTAFKKNGDRKLNLEAIKLLAKLHGINN